MFVDKPPSVWQVKVGDSAVEVLNNKCAERYLGRLFSVDNFHEKEIENRIAAGWASFTKFKSELCCKNISLNKRIMLFDSVVTPRVLYGAAAWTLTRTLEKKLLVARRRMLRMIFAYRQLIASLSTAYPQLIHSLSTAYRQLIASNNSSLDWVTT